MENSRGPGPSLFKSVRAEHGTVAKPGAIDVAPETLYAGSVPVASAAQTHRHPGSV